jgi:hypothetical protein
VGTLRYDSIRGRCAEGTRTAILEEIYLWTRDPRKPPVYWLNGLAGTGKSIIAQTIVEGMSKEHLGAFLFCSRESVERSNPNLIIPTLAYLLAFKYPAFRWIYVPLVLSSPNIFEAPPREQMKRLLVDPLIASAVSTVILIDGLDECNDKETVFAILSALKEFISEVPMVKFLITSRPERHIQEGLLGLSKVTFALHEVESIRVQNDIRLFFEHNLLGIRVSPLGRPDDWLSEENLGRLCEHAAGLFAYAMAAVRFILNPRKDPREQLNFLLESPTNEVLKEEIRPQEGTTICSLYTLTLQEAFGHPNPEDARIIRSVLGAVVLAVNPLSPSAVATLLEFNVAYVSHCLRSVESLLTPWESNDRPVQPFHKTFPAFLTDPDMCTDKRFHVPPPTHHRELLIGCLRLMNKQLIGGIQPHIDDAFKYACMSWHKHLAGTEPTDNSTEIIELLDSFLEKILVWTCAPGVVDGYKILWEWLSKVSSDLPRPQHPNPYSLRLGSVRRCH